jgi:hypothetical protein
MFSNKYDDPRFEVLVESKPTSVMQRTDSTSGIASLLVVYIFKIVSKIKEIRDNFRRKRSEKKSKNRKRYK